MGGDDQLQTFGKETEKQDSLRDDEDTYNPLMFESITDTDDDKHYKQTIRRSMIMSAQKNSMAMSKLMMSPADPLNHT